MDSIDKFFNGKEAKLVDFREVGEEGIDKLLWIKTDSGAFGNRKDGPLFDWIEGKQWFIEKVKKFDVVVQAGGCCGMYPSFYKTLFKDVYTFEPEPMNYKCLQYNCQGEGYHLFNGALGDEIDKKLSLVSHNTRNVGTCRVSQNEGDVQMYKIDDLELEACDLIHLDIEGYEKHAIRGAVETIKKFSPVVIVERNNGKELLEGMGYHMHKKLRMDSIFVL